MAQVLETIIAINAQVGNGFSAVGTQLSQLGSLVNGTSQMLLNFGKESVEVYKDYEKSMADAEVALSTIYGRNTRELSDTMSQLDTAATEWAASTIFHTNDVGNAISEAAHAGWDLDQIMSGIPAAMQLAQAGGLDLSEAVDYIVKSTNAAGISFEDMGTFIDHWAYAADSSATNIDEMGQAMLRMGGTMKFAENTDELLTMLAVLADTGYVGESAGTLLRNSMIRLVAPTDKAKKAMAQLGATSEEAAELMNDADLAAANARLSAQGFSLYDENGNMKSMIDTYRELYVALGEINGGFENLEDNQDVEAILGAIFPQRSITGALALLEAAQEGFGLYDELQSGMAEGFGSYAAGIEMDTLYGSTETFESKVERLKQLVGEQLAPQLEAAMDFAGGIVDSISELDEGTLSALVSGLEAVALAGPGLLTAGGAMRLIGTIIGSQAGAIGMGAIAVAALGFALNDLANTQFKGQFGTNELDLSEVESYVSGLREQFETARTEIDEYKRLLQEAEQAYESTSRNLSSKLISKTITGNALTEEDKNQFLSWGQELGDSLKTGMQNSLAGTYEGLSQTFGIGTGDQAISQDMWSSIVDLLAEDYDAQIARLEDLSKGLVEAMTSAFSDEEVTSAELEKIQTYIDQMNEIYANELKAEHAKQQAEIIQKSQALGWDSAQEALNMVDEEISNELITLSGEQAYNRQKLINAGATDEQIAAFDKSATAQLNIQEAAASSFMINTFESLLRGSDMGDTFEAIQTFANSVMENGGVISPSAATELTGAVTPEDAAMVSRGINDLAERLGGYEHMEDLYRTLSDRSDAESQAAAEQIGNALAVVRAANVLAMNGQPTTENTSALAETFDHGLSQVAAIAKDIWNPETQSSGTSVEQLSGWSNVDLSTAGILGQLEQLAELNLGIPDVQEYLSALTNPDYQWPARQEGERQAGAPEIVTAEIAPETVVDSLALGDMEGQTVHVDVEADNSQVIDSIHEADGETITAEVVASTGQIFNFMDMPTLELDPIPMSIQPIIDSDVIGRDALEGVEGESVNVQVDGDTTQLEGAIKASDAQQLLEIVNGDNTNLNASIWDLNGTQIAAIVDGDTGPAQQAINALGNQTVYINVVARTVGAALPGFAEGGRTEVPSLFGEAGPEWAIPEEHTENTKTLLAQAAKASGFSLLEIAGVTREESGASSSGSGGEGSSTTIVYSPTINASNVDGVEKALGDDKKSFIRYMKEKLMFDKMEVYA